MTHATSTGPSAGAPALGPVEVALAEVRRRRGPGGTGGLVDGLMVPDPDGWTPATDLVSGVLLDDLLAAARRRWDTVPHVAAAMTFRFYTYWLVMPPVLGWAAARRPPRVDPEDVLVRFADRDPFLTFGLRRARFLALPGDPLAGTPEVEVVDSEDRLLAAFRRTLREAHLDPLLAQIQRRVNVGTRTLLGSLASAVAYATVRGLDAPPGEVTGVAWRLLGALEVADLVDLPPDQDGHPTVQRHTCCLAFTLPQPKICSGCCLRR